MSQNRLVSRIDQTELSRLNYTDIRLPSATTATDLEREARRWRQHSAGTASAPCNFFYSSLALGICTNTLCYSPPRLMTSKEDTRAAEAALETNTSHTLCLSIRPSPHSKVLLLLLLLFL